MKSFFVPFLFFLLPLLAIGQKNPFYTPQIIPGKDSMRRILLTNKDELQLITTNRELGFSYNENRRDSAMYFYEQCYLLAKKNNRRLWEADAANSIGFISYTVGNYPRALEFLLVAKKIAEDPATEKNCFKPGDNIAIDPRTARLTVLQRTYNHISSLYGFVSNFKDYEVIRRSYLWKALDIAQVLNDKPFQSIVSLNIARDYAYSGKPDSVEYYQNKTLQLIAESGYTRYKGGAIRLMADWKGRIGNYDEALSYGWLAIYESKKINNLRSLGDAMLTLSNVYRKLGNNDSSLYYGRLAIDAFTQSSLQGSVADAAASISSTYQLMGQIDSAFVYQGLNLKTRETLSVDEKFKQFQNMNFDQQLRMEQADEERRTAQSRTRTMALLAGIGIVMVIAFLLFLNNRQRRKANTLLEVQKKELERKNIELEIESSLERVRTVAMGMKKPDDMLDVCRTIAEQLDILGVKNIRNVQTAIFYPERRSYMNYEWYHLHKKQFVTDVNLDGNPLQVSFAEKMMEGSGEMFTEVLSGQKVRDWYAYQKTTNQYVDPHLEKTDTLAYYWYSLGTIALGISAYTELNVREIGLFNRYRNVFDLAYSRFRDLTQALSDLQKLKEEKQRAENALAELNATQAQLIQSEKMASLGELTAGIAHEIQNPLNFVNNFSELNQELIAELKEEISKGNVVDVIAIANDLNENEIKINHHGKRADSIVKSMLQHSRLSNGQKELTDINALCEEYLSLAYHGMRAKDKDFNTILETKLALNLPGINVVKQDFGRVLLNLFNNAFYAMNDRRKVEEDFQPKILLTTSSSENSIEINVADNGTGIPEKIKEKVFQPFFTTKPTGLGTGLGLSLSYDIIKAHGGEIRVESNEGEGTVFNITIPV